MNAKINNFLGLATSLANPAIGSAKAISNFIRHRVRGWLQLGSGYATKFVFSGATDYGLPQNGDATGNNYLDPNIRKITSLVWKAIHNFYVPDHPVNGAGHNITVLVGTYVTGAFKAASPPTYNRVGIFIRPYYDPTLITPAWVDAWRELTEMYVFKIKGAPGANAYIDLADGTSFTFTGYWATDYFKDWTVESITSNPPANTENYDRVFASTLADANTLRLTISNDAAHLANDYATGYAANSLIAIYRNFMYNLTRDYPASGLSAFILSLQNDIRLTWGNLSTSRSQMAGYRSNKLADIKTLDEIIANPATMDVFPYAHLVGIIKDVDPLPVLPAGTYFFKSCLVTDDGNEDIPRACPTWDVLDAFPPTALQVSPAYVSSATPFGTLTMRIYLSYGALPKRTKYVRIYLAYTVSSVTSDSGLQYKFLRQIDISTALGTANNMMLTLYDVHGGTALLKHYYVYYGGTSLPSSYTPDPIYDITPADVANLGAEMGVDMGNRAITETGIIRWKTATVIGKTTYIGNTLSAVTGSAVHPNQVMVCATDGDGVVEPDVFFSDGAHIIDVEYSDGDEIVGLAPLVERILCLKKKSIVLLSQYGQGGYVRELVSRQVGCCSQHTIVSFDDIIFWADYTGIYSYDTRGLRLLNLSWIEDWKGIASATKEAMFGQIDKINKQFILFNGTAVYRYDLVDEQWMQDTYPITALAAAADLTVDGTVDFLTASKLETINRVSPSAAVDYDGAGYTSSWESNKIYPLREGDGEAARVLLKGIAIEYASAVAITVDLYLDDGATVQTSTLAANKTFATIYAPLSSTCKAYRLKFTVAVPIGGLATTFGIKSVTHYFDILPSGGDVITQ